MLKATSKTLIWEKKNKVQPEVENNNTIKIDFSRMAQVSPTSNPYTRCYCGAILIQQDQAPQNVNMKKKPAQNPHEVSFPSYNGEIENSSNTWVCRFCKKANKADKIYVSPNNSKFILQEKIERELLPPILLFVIDYSGSMEESIVVDLSKNADKNETKLASLNEQINQMIEGSHFYKKNTFKERAFKEQYNQYLEQYKKQKEQRGQSYEQKQRKFYSKVTFFMAVIQSYLSKISKEKQNEEFRVGFIFFNQAIFLMKPAKQTFIPVVTSTTRKKQYGFPFKQTSLSFDSYKELFEEGSKYDRFFGDSRLRKLDMFKLQVENITAQGQTALGPALALALGVASKHDIGSRIILISDAMPNIGLLSSSDQERNEQIYGEIGQVLKDRKISLGILNWIDDSASKQKMTHRKPIKNLETRLKEQFHHFISTNKQFVKEITIDFSVGYDQVKTLELVRNTIGNLLSRNYMGEALQIQIFKDNQHLTLSKFKYDNIDFRFLRFLNTRSKHWIQYLTGKAKQMDFLFPVMTQIVVTYEDIFTKQKYLYMSYVKQKLIKVNTEEQKVEFLENSNIANIQELLDLENMIKFDRENIIPENISSRASEMKMVEVDSMLSPHVVKAHLKLERTVCESLNDIARIQNRESSQQLEDEDEDDCL